MTGLVRSDKEAGALNQEARISAVVCPI